MTNRKNTKKALLGSVIALILCFSMLVGTTFAWFTDSVTSGSNKIQAGTLQIDLELLEKDGSWTSIKDSGKAIFDYDNWEPGYTDVKILKVVNEGTLALKWVAKFVSESTLTELADVIDVYVNTTVTAYPTDRADLKNWTKVGTVAEFVNTISETTNGTLEAGESAYLGIALKMQESAGNKYQGMDLGGAFDIMILATQYTSESDSFDNQYDKDATYTAEINALRTLLANAKSGDTVEFALSHDAYVDSTITVPYGVKLVLDGNGHKVVSDTAETFNVINANIEMSDLTITGNANYAIFTKGATWENNGENARVQATFTNVTVDLNNATNFPVVFNGKGDITMTGCTVTGAGLPATDYTAGCQVFAGAEISLTVDGGKIGNIMLNANSNAAAAMTVDGGAEIGKVILECGNSGDTLTVAPVTLTDGTIGETVYAVYNATQIKEVVKIENPHVVLAAPANDSRFAYDFGGATVEISGNTVISGDDAHPLENVTFTVADEGSASFVGVDFADTTTVQATGDGALSFTNCTFEISPKKLANNSRAAAIIGSNQYYTMDLYLDGCTFNYQSDSADTYNAAIFLWTNVEKVEIKNCEFNGYGFTAIKFMNVVEGAELLFEGNTFNMSKQGDANWYYNNAIQIVPQHDNTFTAKFINNTFTGDYEEGKYVAYVDGMSGLTLTNYTIEHSGNTVNGVAATDDNFVINP